MDAEPHQRRELFPRVPVMLPQCLHERPERLRLSDGSGSQSTLMLGHLQMRRVSPRSTRAE
ncbi:hypothetical protein SCAB_20661 [Streptomyces scabiei 87.22]|uniref:Uncharacterized protein n=1 Tax=Streptomyces scabiei (strain 87.22) TaxID=680198 RepID=C9YVU2_STRSW|nr:hypothetical protein SCAB_20661 [Streptomyces scabiei 87.22]